MSITGKPKSFLLLIAGGIASFILQFIVNNAYPIYLKHNEPTSSLNATYRIGGFAIPNKLMNNKRLDNILSERDSLNEELLNKLKEKMPLKDFFLKFGNSYYYKPGSNYALEPIRDFNLYKCFCIIKIKNTGDKSFSQLHIVHGADAYYEFEDSNKKMHQGESHGNLEIGDLLGSESIVVKLWITSEHLFIREKEGVYVVNSDSKTQVREVFTNDETTK